MSPSHFLAGKGRSFPDGCSSDELKIDPQGVICHGYISSTRRIYLIRFDWKHVNSDRERQALFAQHGVVCHDERKRATVYKSLMNLAMASQTQPNAPFCAVDFGLTFSGLKKLGLKSDMLDVFRRKSPAFAGGAALRAQDHLGDTGLSDVTHWDSIYRDDSTDGGIHLAIIVHFPWKLSGETPPIPCEHEKAILNFEKKLRCAAMLLEEVSFEPVFPLKGAWIEVAVPISSQGYEHFGFRDGITAPVYSHQSTQANKEQSFDKHALGEILLGHARNDGDNLYGELGIPYKTSSYIDLQRDSLKDSAASFFENSSFAVHRKIEQDTDAFDNWVRTSAKENFLIDQQNQINVNANDVLENSKIWIKSKMLGRTPNGKMLKSDMDFSAIRANPCMDKNDETYGFHRRGSNDEISQGDDSQGLGCPFSSHIRRMNPRDDPVSPFIHRPLLRRGMTYTHGESKGMLGLFFCADLVEQFEHLVGAWAQGRLIGIPDSSNCRDPLIGNHEPQSNRFVLPSHDSRPPRNIVLEFDTPFVRTRGCLYLWFPSLSTLGNLTTYLDK